MNSYKDEINKYIEHVKYNNFEYAINISLLHKYIYVETPKVGCSTIKDTLQRIELSYPELIRDNPDDLHDRKYSPLLSPSQTCGFDRLLHNPDFFVFCFVRNPYTRLLSAYLDKIAQTNPHKRTILQALGEDPNDISKKISFNNFVDVVCDSNSIDMNPHWRIQYYQTFQEHITYDFIGRMENFSDDCVQVFERINRNYVEYFRSETRHATNSKSLLSKYYNDVLQEKVFDKFRIDFECFGYSKELIP